MPANTPYSDLKEAIASLEKEQALRQQLLKDEFKKTYESLTPLNFIKNSISNLTESPEVQSSLLGLVISIVPVLFSRNILRAGSRRPVLKQAAFLLIEGLNNYIVQHPEAITALSKNVISLFRKKKKTNDDEATV